MTFCCCKDTVVKTEQDTWDGLDLVAVDDCYWCFVPGCSSVIITYISALESWLYNSSHHIVWQGTTLLLCLDRLSALFPCEMCRFYAHLNTRRVQRVMHVSWTMGKYVWLRYRVCLWNVRSSQLLEMFFFPFAFYWPIRKHYHVILSDYARVYHFYLGFMFVLPLPEDNSYNLSVYFTFQNLFHASIDFFLESLWFHIRKRGV